MIVETYRGLALRYGIDASKVPAPLATRFVGLGLDASTKAWIDDSIANPHGKAQMAARALAAKVMSDYDANALLGTHDMRVLGRAQWQRFVGGRAKGRLLDVGAGDGHVTRELAPLFDSVVTTELSTRMAERLRKQGYVCHTIDVAEEPLPEPGRFDAIALLNVIDRTSRPFTMLERLRDLLADDGFLVVAVPLPLRPHVHVGAKTVDPDELLPVDRRSFEHAAATLVEVAFAGLGLVVDAWTRVPYLSRGDGTVAAFTLDDAVFVLSKRA
ncbi:MAG: methyltransferase domain-containing protein [Polyangiales bacterium]